MYLVVVKAVEHRAAGILQLLGPVDVVLLVKAGAQLDHGDDFLAVFGGGNQRVDDLRVGSHTVQRHFYRNNVGVVGGAQQHTDKGADALVGVRQQHVVLAHLGVQVVPGGRLHGLGGGIEQIGVAAVAADAPCQLKQAAGIQRRGLGVAARGGYVQLVAQEMRNVLRGIGPELQANGGQLAALFEQLAHHIAEVDVVIHHPLVHRDVGVAGHAEQALLLHGAGAEDGGGKMGDHFLHKGVAGGVPVADKQHPLKLGIYRHDAVADTIVFGVQLGNVVNLLVVQKREGMPLIHDLRA